MRRDEINERAEPAQAEWALKVVEGDIVESRELHALSAARILVVDDDPSVVRVIERMLTRRGYQRVSTTTHSADAAALCEQLQPDLLVLDLNMPELDGFGVLDALEQRTRGRDRLPVLVLTSDASSNAKRRALVLGARDFVTKPVDPVELLLRVRNLLETRDLHQQLSQQSDMLELLVAERTRQLEEAHVEMLERLASAAQCRDDEGSDHAQRVGRTSALLAAELRMDDRFVEGVRVAAPLHDIGMVGVPDAVLGKAGDLTEEEEAILQTHVTIGGRLLGASPWPALRLAAKIPLTHHECWEGWGYAFGMRGEEIPLAGRIVAVADAFDQLTHAGAGREPLLVRDAVAAIERRVDFDPAVVRAFARLDHGALRWPAQDGGVAREDPLATGAGSA